MGVGCFKMGVGFSKIRVRFKNGSVCKCNVTCPDIAASAIFAACRQCVTSLRSFAAC